MTKDQTIDALWERAGHGTRREDVEAAYDAGVAAERELWANAVQIDYQAAIEHCAKTLKHAQGTSGCIAFARGAEWLHERAIAAIRAKDTP